ncbi:MAG: protein kinase [Pseudomonadota bacterium]
MTRATEQSGEHASSVPELDEALQALLDGNLPFATFRDLIANRAYTDTDEAVALLPWLERLREASSLPAHLVSLLESDVRRICNEDVPTEVDVFAAAEATDGDAAPVGASDDPPLSAEVLALREAHQLSIGDVLCERYEIVSRAHGGNMSAVYKGHDVPTGNAVAIKLVRPELSGSGRAVRALQDEFEKGRRCQHPNIVRYYALERHNDVFFIVMEWLEGEHLAERINREPGVAQSFDWTFSIVERLASALNVIHEQGFVHADVKPGNVMLLTNGDIKLFDFGVTQAYGQHAKERVAFDASVLAAATPAYSSAGVLDGDPLTPSDDVYSLACLTYRMLAGARPYGELTAKMARESRVEPARITALPASAWMTISTALGHDPDERPQSVPAFVEGIRAPSLAGSRQRRMSGSTMGWWLATALVLLVAVAVLLGRDRRESTTEPPAVASESQTQRTGAGAILESEVLPAVDPEAVGALAPPPPEAAASDTPQDNAALEPLTNAGDEVPRDADSDANAIASDDDAVVATGVSIVNDVAADDDNAAAMTPDDDGAVEVTPEDDDGAVEIASDDAFEVLPDGDIVAGAAVIRLPVTSDLAPLKLVETDAMLTLSFDTTALDSTSVGVYLNALTRDQYKQTLSLLDSGLQPIVGGTLAIRLQPRASWIDAPTRLYRLLITRPDTGGVLAVVPIEVADQNGPVETLNAEPAPLNDDAVAGGLPSGNAPVGTETVVAKVAAAEVVVGFASATQTVLEDQRVVTVSINKRGNAAIVVQVAIDSDSAIAGEDFIAPVGNTVELAADVSSADFRIALVDDTQWEAEEVFRVRIVAPRGDDAVFEQSQLIVIRDDDPKPVNDVGEQF